VTFQLDREYAWGPGDGIAGDAELLAEFEGLGAASEKAWYPLQDAAGDVVCLIEAVPANPPGGGGGGGAAGGGGDAGDGGDDGQGPPNGDDGAYLPRVAANWTFNTYGECLTAEHYAPIPDRHVGHKGFFIDRLDSRVTWASGEGGGGGGDGSSLFEPPRVIPFAHNVCHAGNRAYMPQLGRWLQADPNATGLLVLSAAAARGGEIAAVAAAFDLEGLFGDGANLYEYLGSNPWRRSDPGGLNWVEDYEGVFLPLVSELDGFLPISMTEPLDQMLQVMTAALRLFSMAANHALDTEEDVEWALDWSSSDDDNPLYSQRATFNRLSRKRETYGAGQEYNPFLAAGGRAPYPGQVKFGKEIEERARREYGAASVKRYVNTGPDAIKGIGRRKYDGDLGGGHYMEVKAGKQTLTERVKRQISKDAALIKDGTKVRSVKWVFYVKNKSQVSEELLGELRHRGIEFEFQYIK